MAMEQQHPPGIVMQSLPSVVNDPPSSRKKIQGPAYAGFDLEGAEKAVRHEYDPRGRKWTRTAFLCRIEDTPFAEGTMRFAHRMWDLASKDERGFVVKISKDPGDASQQYFDDVEMQTEARMWAQRFNEKHPPKAVDFLAAYVLELVDREGQPLCGVETFISGNYRKWNNNWDWSDDQRNTPQAFSHFTWEASGHRLLICDLQGVGDLWTDPQIHTRDREGYGKGNMGMAGITKFLESHRCNGLCQYLRLPPTAGGQGRLLPRGMGSGGTVIRGGGGKGGGGGGGQGVAQKGLVGVGLALASKSGGGGLVVSQVLAHGPAFTDGQIMAGDVLRMVEGKKAGSTVEDVKGLILGPPGTSVQMVFSRGKIEFEVTLVRSLSVPQQSVVKSSVVSPQRQRESGGGLRSTFAQHVNNLKNVFSGGGRQSGGDGGVSPDATGKGRGQTAEKIRGDGIGWMGLDDEQRVMVCEVVLRSVQDWYGSIALLRAGACCRVWRSASLSPGMWTVVKCRGDEAIITEESVGEMCARARGGLDVLELCEVAQLRMYSIVRAVQFNPSLQELHVTGCGSYTEFDLAELGLVLQDMSKLSALTLDGCGLKGGSIKKLFTVFVCTTTLTSLSLANNEQLGEGGVSSLCAALRVNASLTSLNLRGCTLGMSDAEELAEVLMVSPSLTDLQVDNVQECTNALQESVQRHSLASFPSPLQPFSQETPFPPLPAAPNTQQVGGEAQSPPPPLFSPFGGRPGAEDATGSGPQTWAGDSGGHELQRRLERATREITELRAAVEEGHRLHSVLEERLAASVGDKAKLVDDIEVLREKVEMLEEEQVEWDRATKAVVDGEKVRAEEAAREGEERMRRAKEMWAEQLVVERAGYEERIKRLFEEGERKGREKEEAAMREGERRGREGALVAFSAGGGDAEWQRRVEEAFKDGEKRGREKAMAELKGGMRDFEESEAETRLLLTAKERELLDVRGELARKDAELASLAEIVKDGEGKVRAIQVGVSNTFKLVRMPTPCMSMCACVRSPCTESATPDWDLFSVQGLGFRV